jgi:hypothetical protein
VNWLMMTRNIKKKLARLTLLGTRLVCESHDRLGEHPHWIFLNISFQNNGWSISMLRTDLRLGCEHSAFCDALVASRLLGGITALALPSLSFLTRKFLYSFRSYYLHRPVIRPVALISSLLEMIYFPLSWHQVIMS